MIPPTGHEPVDGGAVLLRATSELPEILQSMHGAAQSLHTDPTNGWGDLATGGLQLVCVPGDHLVFLEEPHVRLWSSERASAASQPPRHCAAEALRCRSSSGLPGCDRAPRRCR
ncbi:hypothetical protein [Streptomyces exfoliatus]|uniref:hypothetical protein n=1 Tax=Streptomyces exfoliatus TaxID=1905 RepID=UPI003C2C6F87